MADEKNARAESEHYLKKCYNKINMSIFSKIVQGFSKKNVVSIEGLARLFGKEWGETKYLETYEKSLYVYACVSKIAEKIGSIDFKLYQIMNSKGEVKEITSHPALDLIYRVNPFQTKAEFLETTVINLKLAGNAFWYKVRNNGGQVVELWNLRPDKMMIVKDPISFIKQYELLKNDGTKEIFAPDDIVHFKYPSPLDQYLGMSPLKPTAIRVDTEEFASKYQRDFFLNNARPDGILKMSGNITEDQRREIKESWDLRHQGTGKNSKIAVLEGGMEYQQVSLTQREIDYIQSMRFTRDDILVAFKVPKPIVAIVDDVNRANSETAMFVFLSETIKPEMDRLIDKINEMLVASEFGENLFFDYDDPTPENREMTMKEYDSGIKNNYLLINEIRARENLEPVKGGWSFYLPTTVLPAGGLLEQKQVKMIKQLNDQYAEKKKAEEELKKDKVFNGRLFLKIKLQIMEEITDRLKKTKFGKIKKTKKAKVFRSIIREDLKTSYAEISLKAIDRKARALQSSLLPLAENQRKRVVADLDKILKSLGFSNRKGNKEKKINVSEIFNEKSENTLFAEFITPFIRAFVEEAGKDALSMLAPQNEFDFSKPVETFLKNRAKFFAESVNNTTLEKLTKTLSDGIENGEGIRKLTDRVNDVYAEFPTSRAELIARTETTASNNEGLLAGYEQSNVATHKEWIATLDARVRPEHERMNGEIVKVRENFSNGLAFPSEPNCRCVIAPVFQE